MTAKTGKTGKDEVDEVEAVPAEEQAETEEAASGEAAEAAAALARPAAKRKRRVRVIEVIDDEDLDEVLEALDAEDAEAAEAEKAPAEPAAEAAAEAAPKPAAKPAAKPAVKTVKPRPAVLEPPEEAEREPARTDAFSLPLVPTAVLAVLIVVLGGLAIWQGTSAHSMSSQQGEREAIGKVASAYGDVAYNYNATNYQTQTDKAMKLLAGDMLDDYKKNTVPTVASAFQADAQVALSSKSSQVYVGSVNGKFATAVLMMDMSLKTKSGAINQPATLLRLSLSKIDGDWKITQQYPSGINDQNRNQQQGQIPGVPSGGASTSPSPKAEQSGKPKN